MMRYQRFKNLAFIPIIKIMGGGIKYHTFVWQIIKSEGICQYYKNIIKID
jgi:hypothetical protein